jgi:ribosomal protein L11 methylase PrmA
MALFVSFIPTALEEVEVFFDLAPVSCEDVVYDLGSGDGRLVFTALEKGAGKAVGIELNEARADESRELSRRRGLGDRATFIHADIMDVDLSKATVVVCYLYSTASAALKPKFEAELRPGTRVVMESFPVHGWKPIEETHLPARTFYLYRMPPEPDPDS